MDAQVPLAGRERPSRHGQILGEALAAIVAAGRAASGEPEREMCATCAFRKGSMPNQMAATGLTALNIVLGTDSDGFACHHGMANGQPTKLCAGYLLAKLAPWPEVVAEMERLKNRLDAMSGPDLVRAAFDAWAAEVDHDRAMDDYQLARAFALVAADRSEIDGEADR